MLFIRTGILNLLLAIGVVVAVQPPAQNLTTYLLSKYATEYKKAISAPAFLSNVLSTGLDPKKLAYFYEQAIIYGRGYTTLTGNTLINLANDLTAASSIRTLTAIDYMGETAFGLADEGSKLMTWREELLPGSSAKPLNPSTGTKAYVEYMKKVSAVGTDPFDAFVCSWIMGKAFVDPWINIQTKQKKKSKVAALQGAIEYWGDPSYIADVDANGDFVNGYYGSQWPKGTDQIFLDTLQKVIAFWASIDSMGQS